jgi:hypothetical protein
MTYDQLFFATMKRCCLVMFLIVVKIIANVKAFTSTETQQHPQRRINTSVDEGNIDASRWRTCSKSTTVIKTTTTARRQNRNRYERIFDKSKCNAHPCPDPEEDWILDRCEAIFAGIGTIWAYCTNRSLSMIITKLHQFMIFLSMKMQRIGSVLEFDSTSHVSSITIPFPQSTLW